MSSRESLLAAIDQSEHWGNVWWTAARVQVQETGKDNGLMKMAMSAKDWASRFRGELSKLR